MRERERESFWVGLGLLVAHHTVCISCESIFSFSNFSIYFASEGGRLGWVRFGWACMYVDVAGWLAMMMGMMMMMMMIDDDDGGVVVEKGWIGLVCEGIIVIVFIFIYYYYLSSSSLTPYHCAFSLSLYLTYESKL